MIETAQTLSIHAPIEQVWSYVQDMRRWAALMPGSQSCTLIDAHDSRWVLKVGAGGLVRTVNILVHVDRWDGPECVNFCYQLEGDPVRGEGTYVASRKGDAETEVTLHLRVEGSGPMAPMWEAVCKPMLPQLAKSFASKLKAEIEKACGTAPADDADGAGESSVWAAIGRKLHLNQ